MHPPGLIQNFEQVDEANIKDFYLWAGELVSYKRPDILVDAFNVSGKRLVIIGDGPEFKKLNKVAKKIYFFR